MKFSVMLLGMMMAFSLAFASGYVTSPLNYDALAADNYRVASQPGDVACAASSSGDFSYQGAKLIQISSNSPIFGGPGDALSGDYYFDKVLFDPVGLTNNGSTVLNGTYFQTNNTDQWAPRVFWKVPGRDCWNWNYNVMPGDPMIHVEVAGDPGTLWGYMSFVNVYVSGTGKHAIILNEGIGVGHADSAITYVAENSGYPTLIFREPGATGQVYYLGSAGGVFVPYEPVFITERGSRWSSVEATSVKASIATKFAKPSFVFMSLPQDGAATAPYYTFETLITDTLDRTLQNKQNTLPEDQYASLLSDADTGGAITSPLRAVAPNTTLAKNLYRIGSSQFTGFADHTVVDNLAPPGFTYIEKQAYWAGSTPSAVAYDAGLKDVVVNKYSAMAYSTKFDGTTWFANYGIPVCAGFLNTYGDWTSCIDEYYRRVDRHRLTIKFLNSQWIISEMAAPTEQLGSATAAINGGRVKLAKEQQYGYITLNQTLTGTQLDVRLSDVLPNAGGCSEYDEYFAVYDILHSNNVIGQIQVCPGATYTFSTNQSGKTLQVKVHTYRAVANAAKAQKFAETAIYSDEITLSDGYRYNMVSSTDPDKDFKVSLLWKNKDYIGANSSTQPDTLREMVIYQTDNFVEKTPRMGVYSFLNSQPAFKMTYAGISPISVKTVQQPQDEAGSVAKARETKR